MKHLWIPLALVLALAGFTGCSPQPLQNPPGTAQAPEHADQVCSDMIDAVFTGNYQVFLSRGTDAFRDGISHIAFQEVHSQLSTHLGMGYDRVYWGSLRQGTFDVFCWKMTFDDGSDDRFIRLTMDGDEAAGFLIQ